MIDIYIKSMSAPQSHFCRARRTPILSTASYRTVDVTTRENSGPESIVLENPLNIEKNSLVTTSPYFYQNPSRRLYLNVCANTRESNTRPHASNLYIKKGSSFTYRRPYYYTSTLIFMALHHRTVSPSLYQFRRTHASASDL